MIQKSLLLLACLAPVLGCSREPRLPEGPFKIAAYGDSTQRIQGTPHTATRPGWKILNKGASGSTSTQLLQGDDGVNETWEREMRTTTAQVVIINHGLNDGDLTTEQYRDTLKQLVTIAREHKKYVILEQPNNAAEHKWFEIEKFHERVKAMEVVAKETGSFFCSHPDVPLQDAVHPDADGRAMKAKRLAECIGDFEKVNRKR